MNRRSFLSRFAKGVASAALVANLELGKLVPVFDAIVEPVRDYYCIEWPVVTRQWGFGTYVHEVLEYYKVHGDKSESIT